MQETETGFALHQVHVAGCFHCKKNFDLLSASFCSCIARERTFQCPTCAQCACTASLRLRTEFWVTAPPSLLDRRAAERTEGKARLEALTPFSVARPFAIIVDDDPLMLSVAEHSLQAMGYSTLAMSNPEEALVIAAAIVPDLVLTDALMPRMDGRVLCRKLKNDERTREIKVVVMSALYRGTVYRNQAFKEFAVDEYLSKPLAPAVLREAVTRLLPSARAHHSFGRVFTASRSAHA